MLRPTMWHIKKKVGFFFVPHFSRKNWNWGNFTCIKTTHLLVIIYLLYLSVNWLLGMHRLWSSWPILTPTLLKYSEVFQLFIVLSLNELKYQFAFQMFIEIFIVLKYFFLQFPLLLIEHVLQTASRRAIKARLYPPPYPWTALQHEYMMTVF